MNFILNDNVHILCLSCNVKKSGLAIVLFKRLNETPVSNENFYPHTNKLINVMGTRKDNSPVINCDSYREQSRGLIISRGELPCDHDHDGPARGRRTLIYDKKFM
jgi:hypothetical protein